jgi:glycosyltransferase involved in cell wall biosynthesis
MKHALFVAFHYPPEASSSGVLRTLKFTRYLADFGWRVTVLTLRRDAYEVSDPNLEAQIPDSVKVVRTHFLNSKRHLSLWGRYPAVLAVPDTWIGWLPWAVSAGRRILRDDPPALIYSTSPHATAHLIARVLARSSRLPWVSDFRDPWFEQPAEPGTPAVVQWFAPRLEKRVIADSSRVIASTVELRNLLAGRYPHERQEKFVAILNGYDEADFADLPLPSTLRGEQLSVIHAGAINAEFRDPRPLFRALREAAKSGAVNAERFHFRFVGAGEFGDSPEMRRCLEETDLTRQVEFTPRLPYPEALELITRADLLLLLQASPDTAGLVPAKLYEYLRAQKPILAVVTPGASDEVLKQTGGGWAVSPHDSGALQRRLEDVYHAWSEGRLDEVRADLAKLRRFERRHLTHALADQFDLLAP